MQYRRKNENFTTSILRGKDQPKRLIGGKILPSTEIDKHPLVRTWSRRVEPYIEGLYGIAVLDEGKWVLWEHRFETLAEAEECIPGIHLEFSQVAVVQYWDEGKKIKLARELDVDDEDTGEI